MKQARRYACLLSLCASLACTDERVGRLVTNRCTQSFECDKADSCDPELGICVHDSTSQPYVVVLQVTPKSTLGERPLARVVGDAGLVQRSFNYGVITVPAAMVVTGRVLDDNGRAMEAEVAFTPSSGGYLEAGLSVFTQPTGDGGHVFVASLEPNTRYDVQVFPVGVDSELFPPATFSITTAASGEQRANFSYPTQSLFQGKLLDEGQTPRAGLKVRLRKSGSLRYASSIGRTAADGSFQIRAPESDLTEPQLSQHELVVNITSDAGETLASILFSGEQLVRGSTLVMPTVPAPVSISGRVEIAELPDTSVDQNTINADLTFRSSFVVPSENNDVRGRDWCRLRLPGSPQGTFTCTASVLASVGRDRFVTASLLPGDYEIIATPTGDIKDPLRVATGILSESVTTQPNDGVQGGLVFPLERAVQFEGSVLSPQQKPMPSITVTANALGVRGDLDEVALFNRTAEQVSDARGRFQLAVDTGFYDLIAAPPVGSGFAWVLNPNRRIGGRDEAGANRQLRPISPQVPMVAGGLLLTADKKPVVGATVEAFAIVPNLAAGSGAQRAVRVATTTSLETGSFALLLPQSLGEDEPSSARDGGVTVTTLDASALTASEAGVRPRDAGPAFDAGADAASAPSADAGPR
jgi:hypothetical protein